MYIDNLIETTMEKKTTILICLVIIFMNILQAQEPLNYEIPVEAMLIPLFAVDSDGNPVEDLEQNELLLHVNGEPVDMIYFKSYKLETEKTTFMPLPERTIFIIIDNVFNSAEGLRRSKKIASNLILNANKGDRFILIENKPTSGLNYIIGPDVSRGQLIEQIDRIVVQQSLWREGFSTKKSIASAEEGSKFSIISGSSGRLRKMEYQNAVRSLSESLTRFKYVLKTVSGPKIVFLLSEGISKDAFEIITQNGPVNFNNTSTSTNTFLFDYLKEIVKAINHGGSLLYTVNPQNLIQSLSEESSGEMSLHYIAGASGGRYFSGSDVEKLISRIEKTTAAYYELAFNIPPQLGNNLEINIKCKRKGIYIHTISYSERNRPYHKMEQLQKEVFAVNLATGGSWSRMLGVVSKAETETIKKEKNKYILTIKLPETMRNKWLDIWKLAINPGTEKVEMKFESLKTEEILTLNIKSIKGKNQFVVIIEPFEAICLYYKL